MNQEIENTIDLSLMRGKRGLIMGVANDHSIAWGVARSLHAAGAELAFTYQSETLKKRIEPLASSVGASLLIPCDVENVGDVENVFDIISQEWGSIDFVVHAIAYSDKSQLKGYYADTTRDNFIKTMVISCFSFTEVAKQSKRLMVDGGSLLTLTFSGSNKVMPNYNVMGISKAALESSVRYLASDFGPLNIRVNAISAGPMRTLAGGGITDARAIFNFQKRHSPLRRTVTLNELGGSSIYLLSDLSSGVTGEIHYVDAGYNIIATPKPEMLQDESIFTDTSKEK
ncbi:MAG: enoyl-ACP reductase FabI [Alphaproteobacteria bacterium]|jgi:enoyl-[acyl-carrier protein] reductase I|tara:strand:- start:43810 stop:44664 length:855 start_codon:yes stop_codon:yes gene_type:complete